MKPVPRQTLISRIESIESERDKARNLLRAEHAQRISEAFGITMERHREFQPNCKVCRFLEETSLVGK